MMKTKEEWIASMNGLLYEIYTLSRDLSRLADNLELPVKDKETLKHTMKQAMDGMREMESLKNLQKC